MEAGGVPALWQKHTVMRTIGGAFGGQLAATLLAPNLGAGGLPSAGGYTLAFAMCAVALLGAVAVGVAIPPRRRASGVEPVRLAGA